MVTCEQVLKELSNFLDNDVAPELRAEIIDHLRGCHRCSVLVDTTRKVIYIAGDDRIFQLPIGYSERLHAIIDKELSK
jgi:Putative zinc-finger